MAEPVVPPGPDEDSDAAFLRWYTNHAKKWRLNPDPYDPQHQYDYREAYSWGAEPDEKGHWPSRFKKAGHPNLVVGGVDTRTGEPAGAPEPVKPPKPKLTDLVREIRMGVADPTQQEQQIRALRNKVLRQEIRKSLNATRAGESNVAERYAVRARWMEQVFNTPVGNWQYDPIIIAGPDAPTPPPPNVVQRVFNSALEAFGVQPIPTAPQVASGELAKQMVAQQEAKLPEGVKPPDDQPLEVPSMLVDPETYLPSGVARRFGQFTAANLPAAVIGAGLGLMRGRGGREVAEEVVEQVVKPPGTTHTPPVPSPERLRLRVQPPAEEGGRMRIRVMAPEQTSAPPSVVDDAPPLPIPKAVERPPTPPNSRFSWWNPFRAHTTDPQGHKGWEMAQRAWNTSGHLGPVRAEMFRKEFSEAIPDVYHRSASQYLDTGNVQYLAQMPESVQQAVTRFRSLTNEFKDKAIASGSLSPEHIIDNYFSHVLKYPNEAVATEVRARMARSLQPNSPFFKERTVPTLDELEAWLASEGLDKLGVTVDRNPATVMQAYVRAFYKHEGLRELGTRLRTDLLPDGNPPLIGSDDLMHLSPEQAKNYVKFNEPYFRDLVDGVPMVDKRYVAPLGRLKEQLEFRGGWDTNTFMGQVADGWDKLNNLHRRLVMAMPWKHGLFNVGFDSLVMTGLWRGLAHGDWLRARAEGVKHLQELSPFTADLIRYGGIHIPTLRDRMLGFRTQMDETVQGVVARGMDAIGSKVPEIAKRALDANDKLVWEQMVGGWTVGTAKLLFDRAEAGIMPHVFLSNKLTKEAWQRLSYEEKIGAIGRVMGWASGQVSEMMFKHPDTIQHFRQVLFSPMWNASNMAIIRGALDPITKGTGGFAMRGMSDDQRRVVSSYLQSYLMRSLAYSYGSTVLANMTTTLLLDGEAKGPWDNAEGYRARIYAGRDPDGRIRYVMSPLGYMAKDIGHLTAALWKGVSELDPEQLQQFGFSKLAVAPKFVAERGLGYKPFYAPDLPEKGVSPKDRFFNEVEYAANTVLPLQVWKRDPVGGAMATAGFFFRRPLTPAQVESLMTRELGKYSSEISTAQRRGQDIKPIQERQMRAQREWMDELNKAIATERLHRAEGQKLR